MAWWPCGGCGGSCFAPCDCFTKNCELELTIAGWEDNASTDCGSIANRTFNGTHNVTGLNITSSSPYGFSCDFTLTWDDLVLTKLVGGACQCKEQSALYTLNGTLQCGGSPGDFIYSLLLEFRVPVYDEDQGCSPSPCTVEAEWETWTTQIELYRGPMSGNPICNTDIDLQAINWTTTGSAQTTCGLGLDGTDATIAIRFVLCDPPVGGNCETCCSEDVDQIPDQMQVVISGMGNLSPNLGTCSDCESIDGTYVLDRLSGTCLYELIPETDPCTGLPNNGASFFFIIRMVILQDCTIALSVFRTSDRSVFDPAGPGDLYADFCKAITGGVKCSELSSFVLDPCGTTNDNCDDSGATATITAL